MLEKLGNALKKATDKVANAVFLDKNLVEGIVRDLQRALIEADVNVALVKVLSEKIKKAAFDERIKGVEKKEHVIKLLHDELIKILGKSREVKLGKKEVWMLVGLYGSGKCVHAESKVQLSDGELVKAKELYDRYKGELLEEYVGDGRRIDISNEEIFVPSFNPETLEIENKKATHLWELEKKDLMKINLDNGNDYSVKVTPEHPFFVLRDGNVVKVRADEIRDSDYVAVPNDVNIKGKPIDIFNELKKKDFFVYFGSNDVDKKRLLRGKSMKEVCRSLKFKHNYCKFTSGLKKGRVPIELIEESSFNYLKLKSNNAEKTITAPSYLTSEFAEFLGYVVGDGHVERNYVEISTEDKEIIDRVTYLSKLLFGIDVKVRRDVRARKLCNVRLCSKTLVDVLEIFGLGRGRKGRGLKVPRQMFLSDNDVVRTFIRAYFDCDSHPTSNSRGIEIISESENLINDICSLLKRFNIFSSISKKKVKGLFYWRLSIRAKYAEFYSDKIGYLIDRKNKQVRKYREIGEVQGAGKQDMIPLGKSLLALRLMLGFSIGEIQRNAVYSYGRYEESGLISREKLRKLIEYYMLRKSGVFLGLFNNMSNEVNFRANYSKAFINGSLPYLRAEGFIAGGQQISLTKKGQAYLQLIKENELISIKLLEAFEFLADSDVCWVSVSKIENVKNDFGFVYDLTVEDNHSFVADGIVVHNTTSIGKLGAYYSKRGRKVCAVGLDVHRPAAAEQLRQICEKVKINCFVDSTGEEKDALKIWEKYEKEIKEYDLVLVDTAGRDALSDELIKEIKDVGKVVKPTETFLVLTADIGQAARAQALAFKEAVSVSGVLITRMDSTAKGGGALTACAEVGVGVVFIGVGEGINDLELFNAERFLSRLLGMGDLQSLMDKIHSVMDEKEIERQRAKLEEGKLSLRDVVEQVKAMGDVGSIDKIMSMVPGMGKVKEKLGEGKLEEQQEKVLKWQHIIKSMTEEEIEHPEILEKQTSRIQRIARGSGVHTGDVRALLKQYKMLKEMINSQKDLAFGGALDQKTMMKLAKKFGKKMRF